MHDFNLNFEQAFQEFVDVAKCVIDKHAPIKLATCKPSRINKKFCITTGLMISIRKNYTSHTS